MTPIPAPPDYPDAAERLLVVQDHFPGAVQSTYNECYYSLPERSVKVVIVYTKENAEEQALRRAAYRLGEIKRDWRYRAIEQYVDVEGLDAEYGKLDVERWLPGVIEHRGLYLFKTR